MELKYLLINSNNKALTATYWEYIDFILTQTKVKTRAVIKQGLVIGIVTPLNTASIIL